MNRKKNWSSRLVTLATALYAVGLLAAWWLTTGVGERWWFSTAMLYLPRVLYALPLLVLAPLAVWKAPRLLAVQAACFLFVLGPFMGWHAPGRGERPWADAVPIRVLTYNIGYDPEAASALLEAVRAAKPHVVLLQEGNDLSEQFPGWTTHHDGEYFLASRLPLLEAQSREFLPTHRWRRGMRYRLKGPNGPFTLFSIHLDTPRRGLQLLKSPDAWRHVKRTGQTIEAENLRRRLESAAARAWVNEVRESCIVAGDFNAPPDSPLQREHWGGFRDAFAVAGSGYGYTAHAPHPWVRIDRVLATPEWRVSRAWTGRGSGRDHLPVVAELWQ